MKVTDITVANAASRFHTLQNLLISISKSAKYFIPPGAEFQSSSVDEYMSV